MPDDGLTQLLQSAMPLCATLDIRAESQSPDKVVLSMGSLHRGSMTIVIETEVRDSDGKLVAKVIQTQAVLRT